MSTDVDERPQAQPDGPEPPRAAGGPPSSGRSSCSATSGGSSTSMRTALILLLLLALAAIPGSVIPQRDVDSLGTSRWREDHPDLTPVFDRLGLFSVYDSPWFSAIYILLMVSLVGCIIPRTFVYFRAMRAQPPVAPRRLSRMPGHASYDVEREPHDLLAEPSGCCATGATGSGPPQPTSREPEAERAGSPAAGAAYLREAGNLLFHLSVLIVLVGFAVGALFGYKGGVIVLVGGGFSNNATQYDELDPGSLFDADNLSPPFTFDIDDFDIEWLTSGPARGQARSFVSHLTYRESRDDEPQEYDLKVNHPLDIGGTEVFLIGHGYAPVITIRDGNGDVAYSGPTIFLPRDGTFASFGVVKAPDALPTQIGLMGEFYPTYDFTMETGPYSLFGDTLNPALSMTVYTGDLGMDDGSAQSVYLLDTDEATLLEKADGTPFRVDLVPGRTVELPDGLGSVSFDGIERWNKIQISRTPGKLIALGGVVLALVGLLASLFIRPRRVWVRARRVGAGGGQGTLVEIAGLDRSGNGNLPREVAWVAADLGLREPPRDQLTRTRRTRDDRRWLGDAVQPGDRGRGRALLPGVARAPRGVERAAEGAGRPRRASFRGSGGCGRRRGRRPHPGGRAASGASDQSRPPASDPAGRPRVGRDVRPAGPPADRARRCWCTSSGSWGGAWPPTPTGCPGATCTSSRSAAPSSSPPSTSCSCAASAGSGWRRSCWASC